MKWNVKRISSFGNSVKGMMKEKKILNFWWFSNELLKDFYFIFFRLERKWTRKFEGVWCGRSNRSERFSFSLSLFIYDRQKSKRPSHRLFGTLDIKIFWCGKNMTFCVQLQIEQINEHRKIFIFDIELINWLIDIVSSKSRPSNTHNTRISFTSISMMPKKKKLLLSRGFPLYLIQSHMITQFTRDFWDFHSTQFIQISFLCRLSGSFLYLFHLTAFWWRK